MVKVKSVFRRMESAYYTLVGMIALHLLVQVSVGLEESQDPPQSLDRMNCLKQSSFQLSKKASMVRRVSFDLTGLLTTLLKLREEFVGLGMTVYDKEAQLIQVNSLSRAILLGERLPWTDCNATLLTGLAPDHRLILDFVRIVADSEDELGLCVMENIEMTYKLCKSSLRSSVDNIKREIVIREPNPSVSEDELGKSMVLTSSKNELTWVLPDNTEDYRYLIRRDQVSEMVIKLQNLVNSQIEHILTTLDSFSIYVKHVSGCNYFLHAALVKLHSLKSGLGDDASKLDHSAIETECRRIMSTLTLKERSPRGLLSWLFSDHGESISRLISAQHQSVKADTILIKNQKRINSANKVLANNLLLLKETEANNSALLREMLAIAQTRETIHHVTHLLREEKLALMSMMRGVSNQINIMAGEFKRLMRRLVNELSPQQQCSLDSHGRGVACSPESAFVDHIENGILHLASGADLYQNSKIFLFHCLYLPEAHFGSSYLFSGNRAGFLRSEGFFHNKNLSVPEQCFIDPKSTDFRCRKFISQYYEGSEVKPPLFYGPLNYILGKDFAYLQSKVGTILVNSKNGKSFPLGNTPVLMIESEFPIFADSQKITFGDLNLADEVSAETEFFIQNVDASYFDFKLPVMKIPKLSNMGEWTLFVEETEDLFSTSSVFQAVSVTAIVIAVGFCGCIVFGIYICCRKREENPAMIQMIYDRVRDLGPRPGPKPSFVRPSNRNQQQTWLDRMLRRNEKIREKGEKEKGENLLASASNS